MAANPLTLVLPAAPGAARANLLGATRAELEAHFAALGEKRFRATQALKWIHQQGAGDFEAMTNLGRALRARLAESAEIRAPEIASERRSEDGTRKWLLRVDGGNCVETVFIPDGRRGTLCVSSQVGCALNCTFCATARQGYARNLTSAEIIAQLVVARRLLDDLGPERRTITNVVLMGMGEPLLNFDNVVRAVDLMLDDNAHGLARKRVTLSTAGVIPGIRRLRERCPVSLAVSLHAPDDDLRDRLVPIDRTYPIAALLAECRAYARALPRQSITFEYVMLDGVNDSPAHARRLVARLGDVPAKVNLIPFNPFAGAGFRRSPPEAVDRFRDVLLAGGLMTMTRRTRGADIDAACGQLAGRVVPRSRNAARRLGVPDPASPRTPPGPGKN